MVSRGKMKLEKSGTKLIAFFKEGTGNDWKKIGEYEAPWLEQTVQVGMAVYARFAGDGPKMQPDLRAIFSDIKIEMQ